MIMGFEMLFWLMIVPSIVCLVVFIIIRQLHMGRRFVFLIASVLSLSEWYSSVKRFFCSSIMELLAPS